MNSGFKQILFFSTHYSYVVDAHISPSLATICFHCCGFKLLTPFSLITKIHIWGNTQSWTLTFWSFWVLSNNFSPILKVSPHHRRDLGGEGWVQVDQSPLGPISSHLCARALGLDGITYESAHLVMVPTHQDFGQDLGVQGPGQSIAPLTETFLLQEVLELAFSILYDPDETLNFIAPNKYEVSSVTLPCTAQPSLRFFSQRAEAGTTGTSCPPKAGGHSLSWRLFDTRSATRGPFPLSWALRVTLQQ